jgi:hypothetical protein
MSDDREPQPEDPALDLANVRVHEALEQALADLEVRGYKLVHGALVVEGRLPDGDSFRGVRASAPPGGEDEAAGLLLWACDQVVHHPSLGAPHAHLLRRR